MLLSRRSFLVSSIAAPLIIRSGILMPIKPLKLPLATYIMEPRGFVIKVLSFTEDGSIAEFTISPEITSNWLPEAI